MVNILRTVALIAVASLAGAACTTARAVAPPIERPALDVPPVPPRLVEPVPLPPPPGPEPVGDLPPVSPTKPNAKPAASAAKPDPKTEPSPVEPVPPPSNTPPLRTPGTPDAGEATRRIREVSARAQGILEGTDYQLLNGERQAQYENAKRLISLSEDAIKASNFEFARNLAEKAERLAKELQGR
ncbi:MAG TPA: hypothetical protein VML55_13170 [Planctomycetaceae bacterium]|nr:hypothetical protein [Planctomycetaceae bacterium]